MFVTFKIKFTYLCLWQVYCVFSPHYSRHLTILGSCYCKKQINISFLFVCPLIEEKFCHNMARGSTATLTMLWGNLSSTRGQTHKNWHQFLIQSFCFPQFEAYSTLTWTLTCVSINRSWAKNFFKFFSGLCHRVRLETWLILMRMHLLQVLMLPVENSVQNDWQWCLQLFLLLDFLVVVKKLSTSRNFNPINSVTMRK